jgi:nucleotide-binding universal stress UspA family protein
MKSILVPTDFSENSRNAANLAIQLAHKFQSKIKFLHVFSLPMVNPELPELVDFNNYQEINEEHLTKWISDLDLKNVEYDVFCKANYSLLSEIEELAEQEKFDLIVIGLTGSGYYEGMFVGSNTQTMLTDSKVPVLAIPMNFTFKEDLKIAFAYDGKKIGNSRSLETFKSLYKELSSELMAFHVSKNTDSVLIYNELKKYLPFDEFMLEIEENEDIQEGILEYITNNSIDILGIIPRKHSFFERLFHESYTKELAEFSLIPILTIPE